MRFLRGHMSRQQHALRLLRTTCKHGHDLQQIGARHCQTCHALHQQGIRDRNPDAARAYATKMAWKYALRDYGITQTDYDRMVEQQDGKCAICLKFPTVIRGCARLHVDHDHETGAVRGLLCSLCNLGIGKLRDSVENLTRAIAYLEAARQSRERTA